MLIFLHIPKTAGMSFRKALRDEFAPMSDPACPPSGPDKCRGLGGGLMNRNTESGIADNHIEIIDARNRMLALPADIRDGLEVVYGHFSFGLHEAIDAACRYITILRDPVERAISHYNMIRYCENQEDHDDIITYFIKNAYELSNLQTRLLSNTVSGMIAYEHVDIAVENLEKWFDVIGTQERYAAFLQAVHAKYGWACANYQLHVAKSKPLFDNGVISQIGDMNVFDQMLYDRVWARGLFC